jgi:hypothetical protein
LTQSHIVRSGTTPGINRIKLSSNTFPGKSTVQCQVSQSSKRKSKEEIYIPATPTTLTRLSRGEEVGNISKLVVNHKGQHTHLGGTALVQFDGTLLKLGLLIERVPSQVEGIITEVTNEFSSSDVLHHGKLKETNEGKNLKGAGNRDSERSIPSVSKITELGAQAPLGFFDPLGLVADGNQEKFDRLRYVEIKHGRICMLGVVGYLWTYAGNRLEGSIDLAGKTQFADIRPGFAAFNDIPAAGIAQIVAFIALLELGVWKQAEDSFPGDFSASYIPVGWVGDYTEEEKLKKRAIELNQGRAAQMGLLGLMVHEQLGNMEYIIPQN